MPIIRIPKKSRSPNFGNVRIRTSLLSLIKQFMQEAPMFLEVSSAARLVEKAVEEFLFKWSQFGLLLPWIPEPYQCPKCRRVVALVPLTSPGTFVFREVGHRAGDNPCPLFRADLDQALDWRQQHPKRRLDNLAAITRARERFPVWAILEQQVRGPDDGDLRALKGPNNPRAKANLIGPPKPADLQ